MSNPDPLSGGIIKNEEVPPIKLEITHEEGASEYYYQVLCDYKTEEMSEPLEEIFDEHCHEEKPDIKISIDVNSESNVQADTEDEENSDDDRKRIRVQLSPPVIRGSYSCSMKCDWCRMSLRKLKYRKLPDGCEKNFISAKTFPRDMSPERVCNDCWIKAKSEINKRNSERNNRKKLKNKDESKEGVNTKEEESDENTIDTVNTIKLHNYVILPKTAQRCLVPGCNGKRRLYVPNYLKKVFLDSHKIFAPLSRLCRQHIRKYHWDWSILDKARYRNEFTGEEVRLMLDFLREQALDTPD